MVCSGLTLVPPSSSHSFSESLLFWGFRGAFSDRQAVEGLAAERRISGKGVRMNDARSLTQILGGQMETIECLSFQ